MSDEDGVRWPAGMHPAESQVYARNELVIAAPPEQVWAWLVRAERWPEWYANARNVVIEGGARDLALGARFAWNTFGARVSCVVEELEPGRRLAWRGRGPGLTAYHGWVITAVEGASRVVTEETERGLIASAGRWVLRRGLLKWHQRWLEGLATMAARGRPD